MKPLTFNLQMVINMGNYESCRIGGEWSVDEGETIPEAAVKARAELLDSFNQLYVKKDGKFSPRPKENSQVKEDLKKQIINN